MGTSLSTNDDGRGVNRHNDVSVLSIFKMAHDHLVLMMICRKHVGVCSQTSLLSSYHNVFL